MPIVRLGNHAALHNGRVVPSQRVTIITVPDEDSHDHRMRNITHPDGLWNAVSDHDAPKWVSSDDKDLEAALAAHYGCPVGEPEGVDFTVIDHRKGESDEAECR